MAFTSGMSPAKQLGGSNTLHKANQPKANRQEIVKADNRKAESKHFLHGTRIFKQFPHGKKTVKKGSVYFNGDL